MREEIRLFLTALTFFTRIPSPVKFNYQPEMARQCIKYLPLIGFLVASISLVVYWIGIWLFNVNIAVLLSLIASVLITGAFHEDGFIDACDGLGGGWQRDDVLRIMQDSRVGAFGVIGFVLLFLLKFEVLIALPQNLFSLGLLVAHPLSRFVAVSLVQTLPYLRKEKEGKSFAVAQPMTKSAFLIAFIFGLIPLFILDTTTAITAVLLSLFVRWWIGRYLFRRLGGYTGDCLGWTQQIVETLTYLVIFAC